MPRLLSSALSIRQNPRLLKFPPYLSLFCIIVGVTWLFLLPLESQSRKTYISENALLPGQVHTYFGGSDQHVLRAYRHELEEVQDKGNYIINDKVESIFKDVGLKVGRQNYTYHSAGEVYSGQNVYSILQAPRGDATEAIVLVAAWRNMKDELNLSGVALALTLARYFRRWSLWSKDIIFVIPPDSKTGTQAWVDAYHDSHDTAYVSPLPMKSGLLQGALAVDYGNNVRFGAVHVIYDGINGQLPNLDLINSVVNIAGNQMGMGSALQAMYKHSGQYPDRLRTMLRGMLNQGLGHASGPHSSFMPYHVDAVTIQVHGEGWHDEMALGRLVEGTFRSLNNLLEHLHQSFFFYLLMRKDRFVSIGTYLPSAMLIAANFSIMAIYSWIKSGQVPDSTTHEGGAIAINKPEKLTNNLNTPETTGDFNAKSLVERNISLPLAIVTIFQALGILPLYFFNHTPISALPAVFVIFTIATPIIPLITSNVLNIYFKPSLQQYHLIKCFSLLLLGMFLSSLATLNFSLAFLIGLLASPLSFVKPQDNDGKTGDSTRWTSAALLNLVSPPTIIYAACAIWGVGIDGLLQESAFGWNVWGMYTPVIVWCVWWPSWLLGSVVTLGTPTIRVP